MLQAALFDLDGTILEVRAEHFMQEYFQALARAVAPVMDVDRFTKALMDSVVVMLMNRDPSLTNADVFWHEFSSRMGNSREALEPLLIKFYANEYQDLAKIICPSPQGRRVVQSALDRGLRIVLATNPLFPRSAIYDRMSWAGLADLPWELLTTYEDMHFCKPCPEYFQEVAGRLELPLEACLMVGNDVTRDMAAADVGMRTYLVTDYLINPQNMDFREIVHWHGTLDQLCRWFSGANLEQALSDSLALDRVRRYVKSFDDSLAPLVFSEATSTVEEVARALGVEPGMIAKTLLFRSGDRNGLFVVAGDRRVSTKKVKQLLGSKPRMATSEEVEEITGYRVGGVCPFALATDVPVYLDSSMQRFEVIYPAAGSAHSALPITFAKLQAITRGTVVEV
ncbi:Cys-tRNA(Pro)/Cys-tRNA(Cys) deacylase YbaK [Sporotomaculum syntrophicum]|uniref:Cys-tRNA(Pro)/Cys-tRNA(Cys) deacylase YbaK n=1 Tax=Sporotomaculum syntrophicum TaxID=182264 RepID=A0A9D2WM29_9FIRM|nr:Cys-tRNA(Pro)/Cys-tRNA(Cys) deacylase YbaK [Sporotomaculum syntrophicum]